MKLKRIAKRVLALALTSALVITSAAINNNSASAAKKVTLKLNKKKATVTVGKKVTLKVTKKNVKSAKITWKTSKKAVATVSKKGIVTGKKAGKATISAKVTYKAKGSKKSKKKTLKCTVTVTAKNPTAGEDKTPDTSTQAPDASTAPSATASQNPTTSVNPSGTGTPAPGADGTDTPAGTPTPDVDTTEDPTSTGTPAPDADATDEPTDTPAPDVDATDEPTDTSAPDADATDEPTGTPAPDADATDEPAPEGTEAPTGTGTPAPEGTEVPGSSEEPVESVSKGAQYSVTCKATIEPGTTGEEATVINESITRDTSVTETRGIDDAVKFGTYTNGKVQPALLIDSSELDITGMKTPIVNISIDKGPWTLNLMYADSIDATGWDWKGNDHTFSFDPSEDKVYALYLQPNEEKETELEITVSLLDTADLPVITTSDLTYTGTWEAETPIKLSLEIAKGEYYSYAYWEQVDIYTENGDNFECHSYAGDATCSYDEETGILTITPGEGKEYSGDADYLIIEYGRNYENKEGQLYILKTKLTLNLKKD